MKEELAIKVLKQVKEVFDKHGIDYWLDQGTLLSAVRDEKFIPWDHDIDLSTWQENAAKITSACWELRDRFNVWFFEYRDEITIEKEGVPVNISLYRVNSDKATKEWLGIKQTVTDHAIAHLVWVLSTLSYADINHHEELRAPSITMKLLRISKALPPSWRRLLVKILEVIYRKAACWYIVQAVTPSHYFTNLSTIKFYGMNFKVPAETEEYLAYKYGEDWKVPRRDWTPHDEDGAVIHGKDRVQGKIEKMR